jgi:hypothetical protein
MVVPSLVTSVQSCPTELPAGARTRKTSAHTAPSDELLLLAEGLAPGPLGGVALVEAPGPPFPSPGPGVVEADATATVAPIAVTKAVAIIATLPRVRLRMEISLHG